MYVVVQRLVPTSVVLSQRDAESPSFEQIYASWFHEVARWVRAFGGLDADVEDLTQEVFLVVRRQLPEFDGRNLPGWLYRLAQRTVRDYRRGAWFKRLFAMRAKPESEGDHLAAHGSDVDPGELLERRQAEQAVTVILAQMSAVRRTAFILFEIEGYTGEEIAELEGIPVGTVWTRLHHARKDFLRLVKKAREEGKLA